MTGAADAAAREAPPPFGLAACRSISPLGRHTWGYVLLPPAVPHHRRDGLVFGRPSTKGQGIAALPGGGRGIQRMSYEASWALRGWIEESVRPRRRSALMAWTTSTRPRAAGPLLLVPRRCGRVELAPQLKSCRIEPTAACQQTQSCARGPQGSSHDRRSNCRDATVQSPGLCKWSSSPTTTMPVATQRHDIDPPNTVA